MTLDCEPCQCPQPPYLATVCPGQPNVQLGRPISSRFQVSRVRDTDPPSPRYSTITLLCNYEVIKNSLFMGITICRNY